MTTIENKIDNNKALNEFILRTVFDNNLLILKFNKLYLKLFKSIKHD